MLIGSLRHEAIAPHLMIGVLFSTTPLKLVQLLNDGQMSG